MLKIAYLVLVHDQPAQFQRLIHALDSKNASFFVHIDLKSDISEFNCFMNNVFFIKKRVSVNHAGFSLTQAMINLIQAAFVSNNFDYFIFLSGRDYPIKEKQYINKFLEDRYPLNFIDFYHLTKDDRAIGHISKYHFVDLIGYSPKIIKTPLKAIRWILRQLLTSRKFINGMIPYRGSQWFSLNRDTVSYIVDFLNSKDSKKYIDFFKQVWGSDEIFFHSLILNSPYAEQCYYNRESITTLEKICDTSKLRNITTYLHYIDWNEKRENPAVFDADDFSILQQQKAIFARKFCEKKSAELLARIDRVLLGINQDPIN